MFYSNRKSDLKVQENLVNKDQKINEIFFTLPQVEEVIIETFCGFAIILSFGPLFLHLSRGTPIPNPFAAYGEFFILIFNKLNISALFITGIAAPSLGFLSKPLTMICAYIVCRSLRKCKPYYLLCRVHGVDLCIFKQALEKLHNHKLYHPIEHPSFGHLGTKLHPPYRIWLLSSNISHYWRWEHFLFRFYTRATGLTFIALIAWIAVFIISYHKIQLAYYSLFIFLLLISLYFFAGARFFQEVIFWVTDLYMFGEFIKTTDIRKFAEKEIVNKLEEITKEKLESAEFYQSNYERNNNRKDLKRTSC